MRLFGREPHQPRRIAPPRWPEVDGGEGTRVLVEHADPVVGDILERELRARGYEVLTCAGPRPDAEDAVSCPLLHQEHCPAIDDADIVVNGLGLQDVNTRMMLRRARTQHPDLPVIVQAPDSIVEDHDGDLADAHLYPMAVERVVRLIDEHTTA